MYNILTLSRCLGLALQLARNGAPGFLSVLDGLLTGILIPVVDALDRVSDVLLGILTIGRELIFPVFPLA